GIPQKVVLDSSGNMYIADYFTGVRKVTSTGVISTFVPACGGITPPADSEVEGVFRTNTCMWPTAIAIDSANNIYVGDDAHAKVRKILASNGDVYTVAGNDTFGFSGDGGLAKNAELGGGPGGLSLDSSNNLYISDGSRLRKVTASTGII